MSEHRCERCGGTAKYLLTYDTDEGQEWVCGPHLDEIRGYTPI